jgi:hypothetical protein
MVVVVGDEDRTDKEPEPVGTGKYHVTATPVAKLCNHMVVGARGVRGNKDKVVSIPSFFPSSSLLQQRIHSRSLVASSPPCLVCGGDSTRS